MRLWPGPTSILGMEREVDNQVAAPAETRTPNLHRAKESLIEECGWKGGASGDSAGEKPCPTKKQTDPLDSDRPSHGRPWSAGSRPKPSLTPRARLLTSNFPRPPHSSETDA